MDAAPPIPCRWSGEAFEPLPRFARLADEHFVIGEVYRLEAQQERSPKSHRHFFAIIKDVFENLPEHETRWMTSEHLRKWCLIKAGHCDSETFACATHAEAVRWATTMQKVDAYAIVVPKGNVVMRFTAKSISTRAIGHKEFQAVKDAVFRVLSELIEVEPETLHKRLKEAA